MNERVQDVLTVIYNVDDRIYSVDEIRLLIYLIEQEYSRNHNMKITSLNWIKIGSVVEDDRFNKGVVTDSQFVEAVSNVDYNNREVCYLSESEVETIKDSVENYSDYSKKELLQECERHDRYNEGERYNVIL